MGKAPGRRTLIGQALYDTFGKRGPASPRSGSESWPSSACSRRSSPIVDPILSAQGGGLTSPLIQSLGPVDVAIVVYFAFGVWVVLAAR